MKETEPLITALYEELTSLLELSDYLGYFEGSEKKAVSYNTVPLEYTIPSTDKGFIVFSIDSTSAKPSETRVMLEDVVLKFYIGGIDAMKIVDVLKQYFDGKMLYNYYISYAGSLTLQSGDTTMRFTLI